MTRPDLEAILARWKKYGEEHDDIPALLAYIEELTRECDDRRRRCAMLARAHGALADAGCIVPTEMNETIEHAIKALAKERDEARAEVERWKAQHLESQHNGAREAIARKSAEAEVERLSRLENSLPASLRDAHVEVEHLRSQVAELTRERDAANAKHETLSALVEGYRRERDNLRAEITKAQESFDDDGPSGWMPGETAIDALIRTRDEARAEVESLNRDVECLQLGLTVTNEAYRSGYKAGSRDAYRRGAEARAEVERLRKGLEPIADGTVWNAKESAEFLLGRKP